MRSVVLAAAATLLLTASASAARADVKGIDVSEYQATIDWSAVKADGIGFCFARVSDGIHHHDAYFSSNWSAMKSHGIVRGVYQFFRASQDPVTQAHVLTDAIAGSFGPGDLPPVCDVEVMDGVSAATLKSHLDTWCKEVKAVLGVTPIIYTAPGFWDPLGADFHEEDLWVANWFVSSPHIPSGWSHYEFWQYSDSGMVSGISGACDMDSFHGTMTDLIAYAHGTGSGSAGGSTGGSTGGSSGGGTTDPTLSYGATGAAVKHLQTLLAKHGFDPGPIDGVFGAKTEAAVKHFQAANGLVVDGVVGPHTWAKLEAGGSGSSSSSSSTGKTTSHPTLKEGDKGPAVVELQKDLAAKGYSPGAADGDFGPHTLSAVEHFQSAHGLAADGVVGPLTWAKLE